MYIIFLIKLIIRKKKNDIRSRKKTTQSRSITIERIICLEGRNSTIRTHKIESFPPNSRGKNIPPIIPIPFLPSEEQRSYRISPLAKANDIHFPVPFFLPGEPS